MTDELEGARIVLIAIFRSISRKTTLSDADVGLRDHIILLLYKIHFILTNQHCLAAKELRIAIKKTIDAIDKCDREYYCHDYNKKSKISHFVGSSTTSSTTFATFSSSITAVVPRLNVNL